MKNADKAKTPAERHERRAEITRLSKTSFMSNSKWEKLFIAVKNSELFLQGENIKNIRDDVVRSFSLKNDGLYIVNGVQVARYSTYDGHGGPVSYRDIEWIFVPAVNDINALKKLVDGIGIYEYDINEKGMKIYGYK